MSKYRYTKDTYRNIYIKEKQDKKNQEDLFMSSHIKWAF